MTEVEKLQNKRMRRLVPLLLREIQSMAGLQQHVVLKPLWKTPARLVEVKVAWLTKERHRRRAARKQQKLSRKRNRK